MNAQKTRKNEKLEVSDFHVSFFDKNFSVIRKNLYFFYVQTDEKRSGQIAPYEVHLTGPSSVRVQRVHLHPSILSKGCMHPSSKGWLSVSVTPSQEKSLVQSAKLQKLMLIIDI